MLLLMVVVMCSDSADDDEEDGGGSGTPTVDETDIAELSRSHSLPSHILHLRHARDRDVIAHLSAVTVHSISTVLRGSQFGPFGCHVVDRLRAEDCAASDECRLEASSRAAAQGV